MSSANRSLNATVEGESDRSCITRTVKNPFGCTVGLTLLIGNHIRLRLKIVHLIQILQHSRLIPKWEILKLEVGDHLC